MDINGLKLVKMDVQLRTSRDAGSTAQRWTLAEWYEHNEGEDLDILPYHQPISDLGEADEISGARRWADLALRRTTDYRIVGWDGPIPNLIKIVHKLEILTTDGRTSSFVAESGAHAHGTLGRLTDPNQTIEYVRDTTAEMYPTPGTQRTHLTRTIIPVRAIVRVEHYIDRIPVLRRAEQ